jgi:hypothetical protein
LLAWESDSPETMADEAYKGTERKERSIVAEQAGLQDLDHIVDEAMRIAVAGTQAYKWQIRRCLKADVLRVLLQIPTMEMEMEMAASTFR